MQNLKCFLNHSIFSVIPTINLINFTTKYPIKLILPHLWLTYISSMHYLFTFFYILCKVKVLESWKFSTSDFLMDLHILGYSEQDLIIFKKCLLSVCMHVCKILWTLYLKNLCAEIDETLYSVAPLYNLALFRFWCISLKKFCCSKFLISLTQWYRTKLCAIVHNTIYFKLVILKFKTFITAIVR